MTAPRPLRILHLPVDIGGSVAGLAAAQRALGHDSRAVSLQWSPFGFNAEENLDPPPGAPARLLRREINRLRLLWRALTSADVVHCHFGRSILSLRHLPLPAAPGAGFRERLRAGLVRALWMRDLPLLARRGKRLAMTFYGDEARLESVARARNPHSHLGLPEVALPLAGREEEQRRMIARAARWCPILYATNPDLLAVLPPRARLLPYSNVDMSVPPVPWPKTGGLKLLHMPTHRAIKGSDLIAAAVARLAAQGLDISLTQVENADNAQARAAIAGCHVLVDQLRVGWYGGVAVEAMAQGRGVVAYLHEGDLALAPPDLVAELPIVRAAPDSIEATLADLARRPPADLAALGARARAFAEGWHDPARVAALTLADYGSAPAGGPGM